jgi:hypothetical protein
VSEEIEKNAQRKQVVPKISVNKKSKKPSRTNIGYDAAIITDTKDSRFNLFSAINSALKNWFKVFSVSKKKKAPIYTVPDTQRRKGVIQKATSKSGSIFTANSAELRAKIKQRQKLAETAKQEKVDEGEEEGDLSWSPYTDSGFNLLESPEEIARVANPHNVAVEFKKQAQPADTSPAPKPLIPPVPPAPAIEPVPETPAKQAIDTHPIDTRWEASPEKEIPSVSPVGPEPEPPIVPDTRTEPVPVSQPSTPNQQEEGASLDSRNINIQTLSTNTLAISIVAGLSCLVVLFFAGKAVFEYITATEAIATDNTSYLLSATPNPVVVTQTNSITDIPLQAGTLLDINYVDTQLFMPGREIVPPATLISALKFNVLPSFTQSLTDVRFAQINDSAPVIIFEFTDADTVLGGFLAWEDTMAQDLKEIYLITQRDGAVFIDNTVAGKDVRTLVSANGQLLAVYGIVSDNTAIITGSLETFSQVLNTSFDD